MNRNIGIAAIISLFVFSSATQSREADDQIRANPSAAEEFQRDWFSSKVLNLDLAFHWVEGADEFWFKRESRAGEDYVFIDAATGRETKVLDGEALHSALNAATSEQSDQRTAVAVLGISLMSDNAGVLVRTAQGTYSCDAMLTKCARRSAPRGRDIVVSPDGQSGVVRRDNDLWLRDLTSGRERRLTHDGEADFGYGDVDAWEDIKKVERRRNDLPKPLEGVLWSPNGRYIIALRQDFRPFPKRLLVVEYVPPPDGSEPIAHFQRIGTARDAKRPDSHLAIIDTETLETREVQLDPQALNDWALGYFLEEIVWWTEDVNRLFLITANRGGSRFALTSINLKNGIAREVFHENAPIVMRLNQHDYRRPNVHVFSNGEEAIWYSERSGYGHLYLYDVADGNVKHQITDGDWVVFDLLRVDEANRIAYFTAGPRSQGNPYYRYLYSIAIDGGAPRLLTPEVADHNFSNSFDAFRDRGADVGSKISPSGRYFVDSYSTISEPPKVVIRKSSGELVAELLTSDASALFESGWRPPERVVVKAADGVTDLYGVIFRPRDLDPSRKYAVIEFTYPGPQTHVNPSSFADSGERRPQMLADAGFVVVVIDGRGTAGRSREFRDAFLRTEDVFGAADHVAAIRNLAKEHSYMDLDCVGVMGSSYGGYGSLRAMLLYPDFFRVNVSATGPAEWFNVTHPVSVERVFGVPTESPEARRYYDVVSNTALVSRLEGELFLIYGGIDENVPLTDGFVLIDALIKADKDFDLLIVPDSPHGVSREPYVLRRSVEYFVEHLSLRACRK